MARAVVRLTWLLAVLVFLGAMRQPPQVVRAADSAKTAKATSSSTSGVLLTQVRILPAPSAAAVLAGARIAGSNLNATNGFVELARIDKSPPGDDWFTIPVATTQVYRYVKIEAGSGTLLTLAEIEFYSAAGKLGGKPFGTHGGKDAGASAFEKALDGDPRTVFEAPIEHAYVGLDLGTECQSPAPQFQPRPGVYAEPQKVVLHLWPPGGTACYTTDGSVPSRSHGEIYRQPIEVRSTTSIAAMSFQRDKADSRVAVGTFLIGTEQQIGPPIKSYHIGNSLTDTIKGSLDVVAQSGGKNLTTYFKTIPGCSIIGNWKTPGQGFPYPVGWANDYAKVLGEKVDHFFLQPFPNPPGLYKDGEFGGKFIALARQHNPEVQPWLYAQWISWPAVDRTGKVVAAYCDQIGGQSWAKDEPEAWMPPISKKDVKTWDDAMQNTMDYYRTILKRWNRVPGSKPVRLCPGGPALMNLKKAIAAGEVPGASDFGSFTFSDSIHLTPAGAYLVTLVHYACIFGQSPEGKVAWATSGLSPEPAVVLQRLAWKTVVEEPDSGVKP